MARKRLLELIVLTMLGVIVYALKMALAFLPNIEPVSLLILVYTAVFGRKALYPIYIYVGLEIMTWGVALWNIDYLYVWLILYLLGRAFRRMDSALGWAVLSGAFGLSFGALCTPVFMISGGFLFGLTGWVAGIPWDLAHCVGNFVFALALYKPLVKALGMLKARYLPAA